MKKILLMGAIGLSVFSFAQGMNISWTKKSKEPVILSTGDTIKVNQVIQYKLGTNHDGSFKYVQMLNNFNEPIKPAESRFAMMKQPVMFFKEKDGVTYVFTKYFVSNLEAAILSKEIEIKK